MPNMNSMRNVLADSLMSVSEYHHVAICYDLNETLKILLSNYLSGQDKNVKEHCCVVGMRLHMVS